MDSASGDKSDTDRAATRGSSRSLRGRLGLAVILLFVVTLASLVWWKMHPVDTTPPQADIHPVQPDEPLFSDGERQVTFILKDENDNIPSVMVFDREDQKGTALAINTLRRTPAGPGVEIRFEAVRFRRDESEPDRLWVRAVGIANESEGKTPVSLSRLESGEPMELRFHDEIKVPYVAHVVYEILMTMQYDPRLKQVTLTDTTGSIRWKMFGSDAFDEGKLGKIIRGQKGDYAEKPLLEF